MAEKKISIDELVTPETRRIIQKAHEDLIIQCLMWGHDWREHVPGYAGWVCMRCGVERNKD